MGENSCMRKCWFLTPVALQEIRLWSMQQKLLKITTQN